MKIAKNQYGKLIKILDSVAEDTYTCPVCKEQLERKYGVQKQYYAHPKGVGDECEIKMRLILKNEPIIYDSKEIDILKQEYYDKQFNDIKVDLSDYQSEEGYFLTQEQKKIIFAKEDRIKISALAGSAKSSTLYYYAKERPSKKILYLVYNKATKDDALNSFGKLRNVDIKTTHGLAYKYVGVYYKHKLTLNYNAVDVIKDLNLDWNRQQDIAVKVYEMMKEYMLSKVETFDELEMFNDESNKKYRPQIISLCENLWDLKKDYNSKVKVEHDFYLKLFQLSKVDLSSLYNIILLDEAQDSTLLVLDILHNSNVKGIVIVGDAFQCLTEGTLISTPNGKVKIESISIGDEVNVACGYSEKTTGKVESIKKSEINEKIVRVTTEQGNIIEGTTKHMVFGKIDGYNIGEGKYYVYIMFKKEYGYRIGTTSSLRKKQGKDVNGFMARINAERGDKLWIIKVCDNIEEALYYESYYSFKYGIPQTVFTSDNTKVISQETIDKIFKNINTYPRAEKLFNDLYLYKEYPHHIPQASTGIKNERLRLSFTMFGSKKISKKSGYSREKIFNLHPHELSINATNVDYINCTNKYITMNMKRATSSGNEYFNGRKTHSLYDECWNTMENIINDMKQIGYDVEPNIKAKLTENKFDLIPLTNVIEGMIIPVEVENGISNEKVIKVERFDYKGYVYDINIPYYRNYIANNIVVHNCLYGWRNATNIMPLFEGTEYKLTTSFRVSQNIANIANILILDVSDNNIGMKGFNTKQTIADTIDKSNPYACLCRTNSYIFSEVISAIENNKKALFFEGGYNSYNFNNILDCYYFYKGEEVKNPIFNKFKNYEQMERYADKNRDLELLALIRMIDKYGSRIPNLINNIKNSIVKDKFRADVIFSTIHRSKGMTYKMPLLIADDHFDIEDFFNKRFIEQDEELNIKDFYEEMCVLYVAITRCAGQIQLSNTMKQYLLLRYKYYSEKDIEDIEIAN